MMVLTPRALTEDEQHGAGLSLVLLGVLWTRPPPTGLLVVNFGWDDCPCAQQGKGGALWLSMYNYTTLASPWMTLRPAAIFFCCTRCLTKVWPGIILLVLAGSQRKLWRP